jgi:hypothetical protein
MLSAMFLLLRPMPPFCRCHGCFAAALVLSLTLAAEAIAAAEHSHSCFDCCCSYAVLLLPHVLAFLAVTFKDVAVDIPLDVPTLL